MVTLGASSGVSAVSHRAQNNKAVNYYKGTCAGCGQSLTVSRLETRNLEKRWVKCGGSEGCGRVTLVHFAAARAPEMVLSTDEWLAMFENDE